MKKKQKYVIVSPRQKGGGSIALHVLCKILLEQGIDAKILYTDVFVYRKGHHIRFWLKWLWYTVTDIWKDIYVHCIGEEKIKDISKFEGYINVPVKNCKRKYLPIVNRNTVVVYPEIIYGNFLNAKNVVRWLLYYNRYRDFGGTPYGEHDLFFCYRDVFNDESLNPSQRKLCLSYYDLETYRQVNFGNREGKCYVVRKGIKRNDLPEKFDGVVVDDMSEIEKVKIFNECEYCICYDTQTAYSTIAALCGCISIVVPEPGKVRKDYRKDEDSGYGEAFGFTEEEIKYAIETRSEIKKMYEESNQLGKESVIEFVKECENYFGLS